MTTMLRLIDRFFEKNPLLLVAFIGVDPRALEHQGETKDGDQ